ncbi:hypothetical protein ACFLW4_03965 [Chloroflexota bacterium]
MEKRKVAFGLLLVIIMPVLFYFAGVCTETPAKIEGPGGFIEPKSGGGARSPFLVTDLSIQPAEVQPNEIVTITVSVANTHNTWGICSLVLKINGVKEAEKQANVDAGSSQDVSFSVTREDPDSYTVFINGLSGSFTVVAPALP